MRRVIHEVEGLHGREMVGTSARSQLYLLFSDGFQIPDEETYADVTSGRFREWIHDVIERLPYKLDVKDSVEMLDAQVTIKNSTLHF